MRRLLLIMTTALVLLIGISTLISTVRAPQARAVIELNQVDLQLQLVPLKADPDLAEALASLDTRQIVEEAVTAYRTSRLPPEDKPEQQVKLGLLEVSRARTTQALTIWRTVEQRSAFYPVAQTLVALWQTPPRILNDAEPVIDQKLEGWYRATALTQLYRLQQRTDALRSQQADDRTLGYQTLGKLVLLNGLPLLGLLGGIGILVGWIGWRNRNPEPPSWSVPWRLETLWEGVVYWFAAFMVAGVMLARLSGALKLETLDPLSQALFTLASYGVLVAIGLGLLYVLVWQPYPESRKEFRFDVPPGTWQWAVGGWLAALPLVLSSSLLSSRLLGDGGGGNSLLGGIGSAESWLIRVVLFLTVAVAAPLFEETFFRGFVFPSLASHLSAPVAVVASASLFAIAHWSALEFLPLFALGTVLATIYHYTRSLVPCVLLHALWNGSTFAFLLLLGGK